MQYYFLEPAIMSTSIKGFLRLKRLNCLNTLSALEFRPVVLSHFNFAPPLLLRFRFTRPSVSDLLVQKYVTDPSVNNYSESLGLNTNFQRANC